MRIAVAIATTGRAETVDCTIGLWEGQTRPYDRLIISAAAEGDVGPRARTARSVEIVMGPKGLTRQRNTALDQIGLDCDVVVFGDDDYIPSRHFLALTERVLTEHPDIAILTGHVVADGINTAGISFEDGIQIISIHDEAAPADYRVIPATHAYGCNMIVRVGADPSLRFDERLPLYGWLEDLDFSRRMAPKGRVARVPDLLGVHMGTKRGRTSGVKLGYSQVANPIYFVGKRTMGMGEAAQQIGRNLVANMVRSLRPEPWVDRAGRLRGNFAALVDGVRGRLSPERVNEL